MSTSDPMLDIACVPQRKEKRIAVVAFFILALFGSGFMFAHLRPTSTSHFFRSNTVDDRALNALQVPQVRVIFLCFNQKLYSLAKAYS